MKINHVFSININGILEEIFNYDTGLFYCILNTLSDILLKKTKINKPIDRKLPDWYTNKEEEEFEEVNIEKMAEFEKMLEELE